MKIKNLATFYVEQGEGASVLFLHGWGSSHLDFLGTANVAKTFFRCINLDLWGFGQSEQPKEVWSTKDYAEAVLDFIDKLKIKSLHVVGHSFGGKIASYLCAKYPKRFKSLTLVDSAGVLQKPSILQKLREKKYKKLKILVQKGKKPEKLLQKFGSDDYKDASVTMRKILVTVIKEDFSPVFKDIKIPTLIIWGSRDKTTPLKMGKRIKQLIINSNFVILNGGHFCHIDSFQKFNQEVLSFWRKYD